MCWLVYKNREVISSVQGLQINVQTQYCIVTTRQSEDIVTGFSRRQYSLLDYITFKDKRVSYQTSDTTKQKVFLSKLIGLEEII